MGECVRHPWYDLGPSASPVTSGLGCIGLVPLCSSACNRESGRPQHPSAESPISFLAAWSQLQSESIHEVSVLLSTAGPYTSAFFNPALAASVTFHCSGNTLLEYAYVYCLGPVAGE